MTALSSANRGALRLGVATVLMGGSLVSAAAAAYAAPNPGDDKITICHATHAASNPYVSITVDEDSADGDTSNDHGKGDHSTHVGPVFDSATMGQGDTWGDIIPAHDNYGGLNWDAVGQAVYNDGGCDGTYVPPEEEGTPNPAAAAANHCASGINVTYTNAGGTAPAIFNVTANGKNSTVSVAPGATKKVSYPVAEDTTGSVTVSSDGMSLQQFSYAKDCVEAVHLHHGGHTNKPPTVKPPTVKPEHQTRSPHVLATHLTNGLPFTGSRTDFVALLALSLMLGGMSFLVLGGRRPQRTAARS